jgi:hypothetical protein
MKINLFVEPHMTLIYTWDGNKIVSQIKKRGTLTPSLAS